MNVRIDSASLQLLKPQWGVAFPIIVECYREHGAASCVITVGSDGVHGPKSLHYVGQALDLRTHGVENPKGLRDRIKLALGYEFDVVLEDFGEGNEHLHVEFDPE